MRLDVKSLIRAALACGVTLSLNAGTAAAAATPTLSAPAHCANSTVGQIPCTWTVGVNAYPGNSDGFRRRRAGSTIRSLISGDHFSTVVIDVPVSAANFSDAHVEMPGPGHYETYNCAPQGTGPQATYFSPSSAEILAIGRRVLARDAQANVVIRPMLSLGGSCDAHDYYPIGQYYGTDFSKGASDAAAFAHFYTQILFRLSDDAAALGHPGHVILDDATELDCLYDDPSNQGYRSFFSTLARRVAARHSGLVQMFALDWNFANNSTSRCGWPGQPIARPTVNEATRDQAFLSAVGLVGIDENLPLNTDPSNPVSQTSEIFGFWQSATAPVAGQTDDLTADGLVRYLHGITGGDVVLSAIGYSDCSNNPVYNPAETPSGCNRVLSKKQRRQAGPTLAAVHADQNADTAAYCYWTQAENAADPWFLGLWWWNADFDAAPFVNQYDLSWGQRSFGTSPMSVLQAFQAGRGNCSSAGTL